MAENDLQELDLLLQQLCEDLLDERAGKRLVELLDQSELCRRRYLDTLELHAALWTAGGAGAAVPQTPPPAAGEQIILDLSSTLPQAPGLFAPGGWLFSYAAATVIMGMAILGAWAYKVSHDNLLAGSPSASAEMPSPEPGPQYVARITGMVGCRGADSGNAPLLVAAAVPQGRKYAISSGLLEIVYDSGAKVILQGPCTYEVDSARGGFLSLGKLTARVERSEVRGQRSAPSPLFVVRTPAATVTDLGTEFGVEVTADGDTDAEVFEGTIRVAAAKDADDASPQHVCHRGEAVRVGAGTSNVRAIAPRKKGANGFVRAMPSKKAAESRAYAELVLSLRPAVYYRMERPGTAKDRFVVLDSAPGSHHGELRLGDEYGGSPYRPGRFGEGLWLRGPEMRDRVIVRDYPKTANGRLTVSVWVMATGRPGWAMIASNWGTNHDGRTDAGQFLLALHRQDGDLCARVMQRNGSAAEVREGGSQSLPMFAWQHVALVIDGSRLHLYRNGKEVASSPCSGVLPKPPVAGLGIGCRLNEDGTDSAADSPPGYDYWQGWIDELAIFNQALSAQQIGQLYLPLASDIPDKQGARRVPATTKGDEPMNGP